MIKAVMNRPGDATVPLIGVDGIRVPHQPHGPVEDLAFDGERRSLAILTGGRAILCRFTSQERPVLQTILTSVPPPSDEFRVEQALPTNVSSPLGTSCHFIKDGSKLIVTYLNHGIVCWNLSGTEPVVDWSIRPRGSIGRAALSPDGQLLAVFNLRDGFDIYDLKGRTLARSYPRLISNHVMLPVIFINRGEDLMFGSTDSGSVQISDVEAIVTQSLLHAEKRSVQALAFRESNGKQYIATGTGSGNPGDSFTLKIWGNGTRKEQYLRQWGTWSTRTPFGKLGVLPYRLTPLLVLFLGIVLGLGIAIWFGLVSVNDDLKNQGIILVKNMSNEIERIAVPWAVLIRDSVYDVGRRLLVAVVKYVTSGNPGLLQDLVYQNDSSKLEVL
ncbi:hypothetical protein EIP91_011572 [Steccherinum ochraceum]|uniref:Uncharacterized protein n=1 Tax=Steccherinum ochraceum TaxID=92696 RepID=A0A4R0R7R0_9APHY|nr:hypothetical protein EIP91_011572 [Steccherinum ochraceum]